jgi:hypothetical protein
MVIKGFLSIFLLSLLTYTVKSPLQPLISDGGDWSLSSYRIEISESIIEVKVESDKLYVSDEQILDWVMKSAQSIVVYYKKFPIDRLPVIVRAEEGKNIHGSTLVDGEVFIEVWIGNEVTVKDLEKDWVMTHEMVHCTFPSLDRDRYAWVEEGIATYVEPFARLRIGALSEEQVWRELVRCLPQGLPGPDDQGLDNTPTWGRRYWGGALFCLLADIEIRQRTNNRHGLEDALCAILDKDGNAAANWQPTQAFYIGDKATGVTVLQELYKFMGETPVYIDLQALWDNLGVELKGETLVFNESAPLAPIRRAITFGNSLPVSESKLIHEIHERLDLKK